MIDINITLLIQLINFIVAMVLINVLLIKPVRDVIKKRRGIAWGLLKSAQDFTYQADEKLSKYEAELAEARQNGAAAHEAKKAEAREKELTLLNAAHQEAQDFIASSRENAQTAVNDTLEALRGQIPVLAKLAADQLREAKKHARA